MQESPNGVPGDVPRDGMLPSRAAVSTADKLRTLADWLDAHPGARPDTVSLIDSLYGGSVKVTDFGASSEAEMVERSVAVGGEWETEKGFSILTFRQPIMPGFEYQIVGGFENPDDSVPF